MGELELAGAQGNKGQGESRNSQSFVPFLNPKTLLYDSDPSGYQSGEKEKDPGTKIPDYGPDKKERTARMFPVDISGDLTKALSSKKELHPSWAVQPVNMLLGMQIELLIQTP